MSGHSLTRHVAASLLSLCPRLVMKRSPPERWEVVNRQGINRFCDQTGTKWAFPFFRWWFFHYTPSIYRGSLEKWRKHKKCDLVFSPSRSNLGLVSSRFAGFVRNREIYNLGMVSGPVLLKIKGTSWIFILLGIKKLKKKRKSGTTSVLVGGALNDTKRIRKAGAEKSQTNQTNLRMFLNFLWI